MKLYLVVIYGDVEPDVRGPYDSDDLRIEAARKYRDENGCRDGLFRLNIDPYGKPDMEPFGAAELDE